MEAQERLGRLQAELDYLEQIERALEEQQDRVRQCIRNVWDEPENVRHGYVTREQLLSALPNCTLLAIQSPSGTQFEIVKPTDDLQNGENKPTLLEEQQSSGSFDAEKDTRKVERTSRAAAGLDDADNLRVFQLNVRSASGPIIALLVNHGDESTWFLNSPLANQDSRAAAANFDGDVKPSVWNGEANLDACLTAASNVNTAQGSEPQTSEAGSLQGSDTPPRDDGPPSRRTRFYATRSPIIGQSPRKTRSIDASEPAATSKPPAPAGPPAADADRLTTKDCVNDPWNALGLQMPTGTSSLLGALNGSVKSPRFTSLSRALTPSKAVLSASAFNDMFDDLVSASVLSPLLRLSPPSGTEFDLQWALASPGDKEGLIDMFDLLNQPICLTKADRDGQNTNLAAFNGRALSASGSVTHRKWTVTAAGTRPQLAANSTSRPAAPLSETRPMDTAS